ncbi:hypothetical protein VTK56DRAFT_6891 [Thermocarpiscus australiensis]
MLDASNQTGTRALLQALRKVIAPSNTSTRSDILRQYRSLLEQAPQRGVSPQDWVLNYVTALQRAISADPPGIHDSLYIEDFLRAVQKRIAPDWATRNDLADSTARPANSTAINRIQLAGPPGRRRGKLPAGHQRRLPQANYRGLRKRPQVSEDIRCHQGTRGTKHAQHGCEESQQARQEGQGPKSSIPSGWALRDQGRSAVLRRLRWPSTPVPSLEQRQADSGASSRQPLRSRQDGRRPGRRALPQEALAESTVRQILRDLPSEPDQPQNPTGRASAHSHHAHAVPHHHDRLHRRPSANSGGDDVLEPALRLRDQAHPWQQERSG